MSLPEMDSLEADLALPHPLEPARLLLLLPGRALPPAAALLVELLRAGELALLGAERLTSERLAEGRSRGAEDGVRRGGHLGGISFAGCCGLVRLFVRKQFQFNRPFDKEGGRGRRCVDEIGIGSGGERAQKRTEGFLG